MWHLCFTLRRPWNTCQSVVGLFGIHAGICHKMPQNATNHNLSITSLVCFVENFTGSLCTPHPAPGPEPDGSEMTRPALGAWHPGCWEPNEKISRRNDLVNGKWNHLVNSKQTHKHFHKGSDCAMVWHSLTILQVMLDTLDCQTQCKPDKKRLAIARLQIIHNNPTFIQPQKKNCWTIGGSTMFNTTITTDHNCLALLWIYWPKPPWVDSCLCHGIRELIEGLRGFLSVTEIR